MTSFIKICLLLFATSVVFAQVEQSGNIGNRDFLPNFYIDFLNYKSDTEGKTKVDVLIKVPYASVQFQQSSNGYIAKYSVALTFYDDDKEQILFEKLWNEKVVTLDFKETYSKENYFISHRTFDLEPEEYTVVCAVEDQNSKKPILFEKLLKVREFENPVDISDVMIIQNIVQTEDGESIIPNVSHTFRPDTEKIGLFFQIYSDMNRMITLDYNITELNRDESSVFTQTIEIQKGTNELFYNIENYKLRIGEYSIYIEVKNEEADELCDQTLLFKSTLPGLPIALSGLEKAIEQMLWIASQSEIDTIQAGLSYDDKLNRFLNYWKGRDPDASTPQNEVMNEYYRRVKYANDNFKSYFDGWKSDMGMIYITLGPPNQVERQPMSIDTKPYEIWQYYDLNRQFIFLDESGFGHYRLINPQYGEWNRYRQ